MAGSEYSKQSRLQYIIEEFQDDLLMEIEPLLFSNTKPEEIERTINAFIDKSKWKGLLPQDKLNFPPTALEKFQGTVDQEVATTLRTTGCFYLGRWHSSCPV
ncbi:MAG: hypothetical protein VKJ02_07445 [Snowella sp.]|nr:hypothetical protein [Snowella sp.]